MDHQLFLNTLEHQQPEDYVKGVEDFYEKENRQTPGKWPLQDHVQNVNECK